MKTYKERVKSLVRAISTELADFESERIKPSVPTQISSEFLTNKEQGDWAETTLLEGINSNSRDYVAVRYGKNDDINAGDEGFKEFFELYQTELEEIGKRPDLLIFEKIKFPYGTRDISKWKKEDLDKIVPKAKCGIEVRSSAFLIDKYEQQMNSKIHMAISNALSTRQVILSKYGELLCSKDSALYSIVKSISSENMHVMSFRCPSWKSSVELSELSLMLKQLKSSLGEVSKRTFLSITPKVEDLKVVYTWIQRYDVPHYYVQVFFDRAYGISFEKVLTMIGSPEKEGKEYFVESDIKNQGKTTIKIKAVNEENVLSNIMLPKHYSKMKELNKGRLLFYVKFENSLSVINHEAFERLFGFNLK